MALEALSDGSGIDDDPAAAGPLYRPPARWSALTLTAQWFLFFLGTARADRRP